ncbi:hypothetical protein PRIPAC_79448, partial [Pristionchus pacificus]|uniref:G protein-coupled receptor n=1 Tax=Pristionchus pacificus TaxID=54126 RepID=A0A2A6CJD0_PRIPA
MVRPIFLPVAYETAILVYFECVFVCSLCLHEICLFLMVTRTPPAQMVVRNYLILIQIMVLLTDAHTDFCMRPIPLFPALAGYGNGMAVRMGLPINLAMAIMAILWTYVNVAIVRCIVHRHQTIVDDNSAFKFRKGSLIVTELLLAFLVPVPMLIWYANGNDRETNERNLIADPHNITWIRERGFYYVDVPGTSKIAMMIAIILTIFLSSLLMVLAFVHMFYTLWKDSAKRSAMSIRLIKRSITNLFLQSQARIFLYLQIMFAASCCFNALALFFVVTQTPSSHAMVRKYLIAIQIILIISDVHLEILFQPIPIFPALGGFAVGLLIRTGFSLPTELAITIVIYIYTGFVSILCLIYRHQTVVLPGNPLKFRKRSIHFVHFVMLAPPPFLGILIAFIENDQANVELIKKELFLPMNLFVVPATLIILGLLFDALFSFETMLAIFLVLPTHSIGRNLILLIITPVYRKLIVSCLLKPCRRNFECN